MFSYDKTVPDEVEHADRVVVVPDVHRDLDKARRCLRAAGVIDARDTWTGGAAVVVQVGDQVDGGDRSGRRRPRPHECHRALREDVAVLRFFNRLHRQAARQGGAVYSLLGNHEVMNAQGVFAYADTGGCPACEALRERVFSPGGAVARILATTRAVYLRVGRVGFVHAGFMPWHLKAASPARLNAIMTDALLGNPRPRSDLALLGRVCMQGDGALVTRAFTPDRHISRGQTEEILAMLGVDHLVIGHNASAGGIVPLHGGLVYVCDPGMSSAVMDAEPQALEIRQSRRSRGCRFRVVSERSGRT